MYKEAGKICFDSDLCQPYESSPLQQLLQIHD